MEAGRLERRAQRAASSAQHAHPVGPLDREPAEMTVAHGESQRVHCGLERAGSSVKVSRVRPPRST